MVPREMINKLWFTWLVKSGLFVVITIVFAAMYCAQREACTDGWWPWWMTIYGWSIVVTLPVLALVTIWATDG